MVPHEPTALPLYRQIGELLVREIDAGRLLEGERLDPERDMAAQLGTSVGTLRKALAFLEREGLLERRQGSGNYVRHRSGRDGVYAFFRIERLSGGGAPGAEILSVERCAKPAGAPQFGSAAHAHRIRRLRRLDGIPAVAEEIWLDGSYAETLTPDDLGESLYLAYKERLDLWIMRAEDRVSVAPAPAWVPPAFGVRPDAMCGHVERISWSQTGARAEWSQSWFDPAVARYVQRIK
ncbi:GntR family transcriptional regulator [Acuticoccus sp. MNP-M23]|uniref:GntR family transcriptional regulator n=1 Tax=Acuticoccus sp. MNP-M23 TaxID=3072793 RepID=UPI00281564AB|nr:GntR family transcriptional regulator [Acuticoccus sp. MNP-M23]WMS44943.1 GntR family transcriptional regulator [Acuticoccus sp. MNP-M23]